VNRNSSRCPSVIIASAICSVCSGVSGGTPSKGTRSPSMRMCGGDPACMWMSDAPRETMLLSRSAMRMPLLPGSVMLVPPSIAMASVYAPVPKERCEVSKRALRVFPVQRCRGGRPERGLLDGVADGVPERDRDDRLAHRAGAQERIA
jgi:hypothetical protein